MHLLGVSLKSQDQKDQNEDGLFNRFLIAVAYKHHPNRETIEPNNKIPKLAHLFYLTKKLHGNPEEYTYNDEGNFTAIIISLFFYVFQQRNLLKMLFIIMIYFHRINPMKMIF